MKLTKQQIQDLYKFTRQHYVEWYDLQSELVDHLANDIEQIWKQEPNITFDEAKQKSFKKFGVFGFMDIVEQRHKALNKRYFRLFWKEFKGFFTIPKIIFTVSLFFAVLFFIRLVNYNKYIIFTMVLVILIIPFIHMCKNSRKIKLKVKKTGRKYMFEDHISNLGFGGGLIQFPIQILIRFVDSSGWTFTTEVLFTSILVICMLTFYILIFIIPPKVRAIIAKEHPEYQLT
jgi:hypothetical protein